MEQSERKVNPACLERHYLALTVDDVYDVAKLIGVEVEKLIDGYGKESAEGLVPKIVKVLELLERFAARNNTPEQELIRAFETLQVQQQRKKTTKEAEDRARRSEIRDLELKEQKWRKKAEDMQGQVTQLREQNQQLLSQLTCNHSQEDSTLRKEREVMVKLKEVVDKQRDEIRAQGQEISSRTREVEALQEQLERFMKMNGDLRHKQSVAQAQVKSAVERKADLEANLKERQKEIDRLSASLRELQQKGAQVVLKNTEIDLTNKMVIDLKDPNRPCFTKQEVKQILVERNELKANLFLVQEELCYYQREILNDERCPGFLMEAVSAAINKQRRKIKAKMLGIPEGECSSDEEERGSFLSGRETGTDCTDGKPADSRIRNLFGILSRHGSGKRSPETKQPTGSWEIIGAEEAMQSLNTEAMQSPNTEAMQSPNTEAMQSLNTEAMQSPNTEAMQSPNTEAMQSPNTEASSPE